MKKLSLLIVPCVILMAGCKKELVQPDSISDNTTKTSVKTQGYLKVQCDNCKVEYGMPDQYKTYNVSGTSLTAYFNYTSGYSLQTYITALDHTQNIIYSVYNRYDKLMFADTVKQTTTGYWSSNVLMHDN